MNYRHLFHAGNFADVHKHIVLVALLDHLLVKPKPILYLDTHAGRGSYDLQSAQAAQGDEWQHGIGRIAGQTVISSALSRYLALVRQFNSGTSAQVVRHYPGSPLLASTLLRETDRLVLVEKHPEEAAALRSALPRRRNTSVLCEDGYAALKAYLPPRENRGLVLIDPPYESTHEFDQLRQSLLAAHARWPTGMYCIWYPITADAAAQRFKQIIAGSGLRKLLTLELWVRPIDSPLGLNGSGLAILNPPWQLDEEMQVTLPALHRLMAPEGTGGTRVDWLVPE